MIVWLILLRIELEYIPTTAFAAILSSQPQEHCLRYHDVVRPDLITPLSFLFHLHLDPQTLTLNLKMKMLQQSTTTILMLSAWR